MIDWKDFEEDVEADYELGEDGYEVDSVSVTLRYNGSPRLVAIMVDRSYYERLEAEGEYEFWEVGASFHYETPDGNKERMRLQVTDWPDYKDKDKISSRLLMRAFYIMQEMVLWYKMRFELSNGF